MGVGGDDCGSKLQINSDPPTHTSPETEKKYVTLLIMRQSFFFYS